MADRYDVIVVGAGAAGIGMSVVLKRLKVDNFVVLERNAIGESFRLWPREMRFISPSFTGNLYGAFDLNAITPETSPGYSLKTEHPTGKQYAKYLEDIAAKEQLPVETGIDVREIIPHRKRFRLRTSSGDLFTRIVIWAAGDYQYPRLNVFKGSNLCIHSGSINSWTTIHGDNHVIIGAGESGIDAAIQLAKLGKKVTVLDSSKPWTQKTFDSSSVISPFTRSRLRMLINKGNIKLKGGDRVMNVEKTVAGYRTVTQSGRHYPTIYPPILALGYDGSVSMVRSLLDWDMEGHPMLSLQDESTKYPGFFLVGPEVRHGDASFGFIYKFRQRFAVVGDRIAMHLGLPVKSLEEYRHSGFYLDDLSRFIK